MTCLYSFECIFLAESKYSGNKNEFQNIQKSGGKHGPLGTHMKKDNTSDNIFIRFVMLLIFRFWA